MLNFSLLVVRRCRESILIFLLVDTRTRECPLPSHPCYLKDTRIGNTLAFVVSTQHPQLQDTIKALKVRFGMEGLTYTQAANHLTTTVSELPEYHMTCKVSSAGTTRIHGGGGGSAHKQLGKKTNALKKGVYMPDGTISTGFYLNWKELDKEEKQQVTSMVSLRLKH